MKRLGVLLCSSALLAAGSARAEESVDATESAMRAFFAGEKAQGWVWGGAGVASVGAGSVLLAEGGETGRGLSYPLLAVGAIQIAAGVLSLTRADARAERLAAELRADPAAVRESERSRMKTLDVAFTALEVVEVALIVAGIGLATWTNRSDDPTLRGVGLGLAVEGVAMFGLDHAAHARAARYLEALER